MHSHYNPFKGEVMGKVIKFPDLRNIPLCLRNIADEIEAGDLPIKSMTIATSDQVYHLGTKHEDEAIKDAIFNMTIGIDTLMSRHNRTDD
jgi:hypothetical protein